MAAARFDAALWELHRPLQEAPDGAEPAFAVAPATPREGGRGVPERRKRRSHISAGTTVQK